MHVCKNMATKEKLHGALAWLDAANADITAAETVGGLFQ